MRGIDVGFGQGPSLLLPSSGRRSPFPTSLFSLPSKTSDGYGFRVGRPRYWVRKVKAVTRGVFMSASGRAERDHVRLAKVPAGQGRESGRAELCQRDWSKLFRWPVVFCRREAEPAWQSGHDTLRRWRVQWRNDKFSVYFLAASTLAGACRRSIGGGV